jgi:cation diffusion facilitator family transporter
VINLVLSASKMAVGIVCHSSALMADAGHSLSDLFSDVVTLVAVSIGRLPPDEDHPFGHGKFEAIGSLFLSLILLGTGLGIGLLSNQKLVEIISLHRSGAALAASQTAAASVRLPGFPALIMAGISVVSKEWLFRVTRNVGERLQSTVVIANAWHHRSDAYTSVMAVASIALARYIPGLVFCDAAAGLLVAATIGMTGAEILGQSINELTDHRQIVADAESSSSLSAAPSSLRSSEVVENWEVPSSLNDTVSEPILDARPDTGMAHRRVVDRLIDQHSDYVTVQALRTTDQNHIHVFIESSTGDLSKLSGLTQEIVAALEDRPDVVQANVYLDLKTTTTSSLPRSTSPTTSMIQSQFD